MTELAVNALGLHKKYRGRSVVHNVDLQVPAGSALGLVGPNGAGKTTIIKMILGIVHPSQGQVQIFGVPCPQPRSRQNVGYLPERLLFPDNWTPIEHLQSIARLKGGTSDPPESLLELVGLEPQAFHLRLKGFSKGMRQRVGLAAALVGRPKLLILDEPTDGIDPLGRIHIRELLAEQVKAGATVFLNSHLLAETERLCDRVAILAKGHLLASGTLAELQTKGAPTAYFATHPHLDEITARHKLKRAGATGFVMQDDASDEAMSSAIASVLAEGLVLVELSRTASDLEGVLREVLQDESKAA